jgi:hypothetical protein
MMTHFKELSQNLPGVTNENHKKCQCLDLEFIPQPLDYNSDAASLCRCCSKLKPQMDPLGVFTVCMWGPIRATRQR